MRPLLTKEQIKERFGSSTIAETIKDLQFQESQLKEERLVLNKQIEGLEKQLAVAKISRTQIKYKESIVSAEIAAIISKNRK